MKRSSGRNIGNITDAINKTVIRGTPLQNSINPTAIYLVVGNGDLLANANTTPIGKQNIKQKKATMNVRDNPPHEPVSIHSKPKEPPDIR